jgi:hypothetical protein
MRANVTALPAAEKKNVFQRSGLSCTGHFCHEVVGFMS